MVQGERNDNNDDDDKNEVQLLDDLVQFAEGFE